MLRKAEDMLKDLTILYEDNDIILCHKPAGIATQTKRLGQQDMESLLKNYRVKKGEAPYIGIIHRLDQPVEGIMVFAKNQKAAANLSKQVQQHVIGKYYYALSAHASGIPNACVLEDYLLTDKKTNVTRVVDVEALKKQGKDVPKEIKKAKLEYKVIETKADKVLFDIKLYTGRQHQIRVQMANAGCSLVGDTKYGKEQENSAGKNGKTTGLALCSYRLQFVHPSTGEEMDYKITPQGIHFKAFFE